VKRSIVSALTVVAAAFALSACGTGMNSQTAQMEPAVPGANLTLDGPGGNGTIAVRNAALVYPGTEGYKAGSEATAQVWLLSNTAAEQLVVIKYEGQEIKRVTIKSRSFDRSELKFKVNRDVRNHESVRLTFEFVGVKQFDLDLPVAPPNAPAPAEKIELPETPGGEGH
jgi:hypothetical protein